MDKIASSPDTNRRASRRSRQRTMRARGAIYAIWINECNRRLFCTIILYNATTIDHTAHAIDTPGTMRSHEIYEWTRNTFIRNLNCIRKSYNNEANDTIASDRHVNNNNGDNDNNNKMDRKTLQVIGEYSLCQAKSNTNLGTAETWRSECILQSSWAYASEQFPSVIPRKIPSFF